MTLLTAPLTRARELHHRFGLKATLGLAFKKILSPVARVGSVYLMECDLTAGPPQLKTLPGFIAREAFLEDIDLLDDVENGVDAKRDATARFKRGDRWFVGIDSASGKLANFRWSATAWELVPELERNIIPKPGEAFVYALYTAPDYRRRGVDSFTRSYTYNVLHQFGIRRILATIFAENTVSMKAGRKYLNKVGRVWYASVLGGRTRVFCWPNSQMPTFVPAEPVQLSFRASQTT